MMSLKAILREADYQAKEAANENMTPYVYHDAEEVDRRGKFPFPNIGSYVAEGWTELDDEAPLFCDKMGEEPGDGVSLSP